MRSSHDIPSRELAKPRYLAFRSSKLLILTTVALATFSDTFLYSIMVPVFPTSLPERAHVAKEDVQVWISILLAIYGGALLIAAPLTGFILDKCESRKVPFLSGVVTLAAATAMLCVGNSIGLLISGRIVSGLSAAIVWTASTAIITANIDNDEIGKALGIAVLGLSLGDLAGPILGGVVYEHGGYYAVFGMAFAVLGMDAVLRLAMVEKVDAAKWQLAETPISMVPGTQSTDFELFANHSSIPTDIEVTTQVTAMDLPTPKKQLPTTIRLLCSYRILIAIAGSFVMASLSTAFESVLPLYVETELHFSPSGAGLLFIPLGFPSLIDPLIGHICDKRPRLIRYIAAIGFIGAVCPLVLLRLVAHSGIRQVVLLCGLLAIIGLCIAITAPPLLLEINRAVETIAKANPMIFGKRGATAQGYGLFICAYAGGSLVGPLMAGLIKNRFSWGVMAWVLGILSALTAPPVFLWLGGWIGGFRTQPV